MIPTNLDDDRITVFDDAAYRDVATVNFEGTVIAFARTPAGIAFNVLALDGTPGSDTNGWSGFEPLALPDTVRPAGMNIINVPSDYDAKHVVDGLQDAGQPFRVLASRDYIYLFRQAKKGTLLVNRLRLIRAVAADNPQEVRYTLQPAWEARFRQSGKPDTPADDKDVPSFLSADNEPFVEPTIELFMIEGLTDGNFDVAFLPRNEGALATLQVFVTCGESGLVHVYSLPIDASGLVVLDPTMFSGQRIPPAFSFTLTDERGTPMPIAGRPSAAFYLRQERVVGEGRDTFTVKRTGRLFLAMEAGAKKTLASVDFGVAADGTLARPTPRLKAGPVTAAPLTSAFDRRAYVELPEWTPVGGISLELWIYPLSLDADKQLLVGNSAGADCTPFLRVRRGGVIEFGVSTGHQLIAQTPAGAIRQSAWSFVRVSYDPAAASPMVIEVNGSPVPHRTSTGGFGDELQLNAVGDVGRTGDGFVGLIEGLITYAAPNWPANQIIGQFDLQAIEYTNPQGQPIDPPLTPNAHVRSQPARVFGAHLVPSPRPAAGSEDELTWDERGLTIYTAYFKDLAAYGEINSPPFVLAGADGRLHVYFRGRGGRFSVMHLDTEAARATFAVPWQTGPDASGSGWMQFVSTRSGGFMNDATVEVLPAPAPAPAGFCTVMLGSPSGRRETWTGVPRSLLRFSAVLAGGAIDDPNDMRVQSGDRVYFDARARRPAVYLPIAGSDADAMLGIVSQQAAALPLASVTVSPAGDGLATVTLRHRAPRWDEEEIVQTWPNVPLTIDRFVETLRGQSPAYSYRAGMSSVLTCSLSAFSELVAANRVVLFFRKSVTKVTHVSVADGSTPGTCDVSLALERSTGALSATWRNVPRAQQLFAATIQGENPRYDYSQATGDAKTVQTLLVVTTDGGDATVEDTEPAGAGDAVNVEPDLRVSASLVALVVTAPAQASGTIPGTPQPVRAALLQSATYSDGTNAIAAKPIDGGSALFRAAPASVPASGKAGLVIDTSACPDGKARLALQGFEGGWVRQPGRRTLSFGWINWLQFETSAYKAPNISALTIEGDMSLELWCRPLATNPEGKPTQRLLTFNRAPAPDEGGGGRVSYLAGLAHAPSLACEPATSFHAHVGGASGTFSLWFRPDAAAGPPAGAGEGVIGFMGTGTEGESLIVLSVGSDRTIHVTATPFPSAPAIVGPVVAPNRWSQVAITYETTRKRQENGEEYSLDITLFVNGVRHGNHTYRLVVAVDKAPSDPSSLFIGGWSSGTLPMAINEVAFFERALAAEEVERYAARRIPDNADRLVLKWMLTEGKGSTAINSAPTRPAFDAAITPEAKWRPDGIFWIPVLGHGDNVALLPREPILHEWAHLAFSHQTGHALRLQGRDYADCGNDETLKLDETFSIEAWVQHEAATGSTPQTVLAKGDDYALSITPAGEPQFAVKMRIKDKDETLAVTGSHPLPANEAAYVAATFQVVPIEAKEADPDHPQDRSKDKDTVKYEVHMDLYVNGNLKASGIKSGPSTDGYTQFDDAPTRVSSNARLNLGRSPGARGSRYFRGFLADVRLWTRLLSVDEIKTVKASRRMPANREGLVSSWQFAESSGRLALDPVGQNNARLSRASLRVNYPPTAVNTFFVDGREAEPQFLPGADAVGGYGYEQFLIAKKEATAHPPHEGFVGQIDDVRIWARQLTAEQVADNMHTPLVGDEPALRGYWNFDSGSGLVVPDVTGRGNDGTLTSADPKRFGLPKWTVSAAPLGDEAPAVWNMLGGLETGSQIDIVGTPSVVEYADVQRDAYGQVFSVMKRAYVAAVGKAVAFVTGYKIGDLDTVYLGQAQSKPTLIGFIEGAPPIPSENQTLPSWRSGFGGIQAYSGATSVAFEEADDTTYTFAADRATSDTHQATVKAGGLAKPKIDLSEGVGVEVTERIFEIDAKLGGQFGYENVRRLNRGVDAQTGSRATLATMLSPGGAWEPGSTPGEWVNPAVGRRFIPNNTGLAVVKSLTVDLVASVLRTSGTMVKITAVPNPDIPEDVNLIDFPIDPRYVKNGTLDGKVGLANDPDYPEADRARGSYFRPLEAYALKRRLERADAQLEAYFQQYDEGRRATRLRSGGWNDFEAGSRDTRGYDWARHLAKRSIVNTYVWTAGGGSYAEQTQPINVFTESHGAIASETVSAGASLSLAAALSGFGGYSEFDYLFSSATAVTITKMKREGASFALMAKASPDSYLYAPRIAGGDVTFANAPTEGKVDGYRYMAIFAAPSEDHTTAFFQDVVDKTWLGTSRDPNAAALRGATGTSGGPWRVLYRVTYVSRIPPKFQPAPAETLAPDVQPPANLAYNAILVQLVRGQITVPRPSPVEIGQAIAAVIGTPGAPGLLAGLLPWWAEFLCDSTDYGLPAGRILRALRGDLLQYMIDDYASREAAMDANGGTPRGGEERAGAGVAAVAAVV